MILAAGAPKIPSDPIVSVVVAGLLVALSVPIIRRVAGQEDDPRLVRVLTWCLVLHLLSAPLQIFVVDHVYHGVSDFTRYVEQAARMAPNFRSVHFTTVGSGIRTVLGDGSVSIAAGVVFTFVGVNQLAGFLVFAWLSFVGTIFFYRAFSITFPGTNRRRYALMLFLLPSTIYWTSDVSKESIMLLSLGVASFGCARVLTSMRGGYPMLVVGALIGIAVRPNELALLLGAFTVAMFFRGRLPGQLRAARHLSSFVFLAVALAVSAVLTVKFIHSSAGSLSGVLNRIGKNNTGQGAGFGSSNVAFSADPLLYPRDVYTVLLDPLPFSARSIVQFIAATENTIILVLVLKSLRQLRVVFRAAIARPYVMFCLVYTAFFLYAFAALGNLGLIERERTLLFPFFLVLLALPLSAKNDVATYPWELRRPRRRDRYRSVAPTPVTGSRI
jgi:hypothetical protein